MRLQRLYCYTIACLVWLTWHADALRAQTSTDATASDSWHFQYDLFQMLLERQGLAPVANWDQAFARPGESVIVIAGDPSLLPAHSQRRLSRFVQRGGALLLATDYPLAVPGIARFAGEKVTSEDAETRYQGFNDCVKVNAVAGDDPRLVGVSTIITNRSSWLELDRNTPFRWDIVAEFPENCLPLASRWQPLLAIGDSGAADAGVIVLSADASPFTNGMLWHGDNAILAIRISTLLAGTGRNRLAFSVDSQVLPSMRNRIESQARANPGSVEVKHPLPEPDLQKVLKLANAVAKEVAQSNVLNETLKQRPRHRSASQYFRWLLVMASATCFFALAWILSTSGALRPFTGGVRKAFGRRIAGARAHAPPEPADYRTPAGFLAREFCWELTGSRHSTDWQKYLARQLVFEPTLGPSDQQELAKIVDIASRGCRERMTASDFEQLGKTIAVLRAKHEAAKDLPSQSSSAEQARAAT